MYQPASHILHHIPAKEPRVGKVEIPFWKHLLVGRDEDHLRVEVGANGVVLV